MKSISALLLAGTALFALNAVQPPAQAGDAPLVLAQADTRAPKNTDTNDNKRAQQPPAQPRQQAQPPVVQPHQVQQQQVPQQHTQQPVQQQQVQQPNRPQLQSQQDDRPVVRERRLDPPAAQTPPTVPQNNRGVVQQRPVTAPNTAQTPATNNQKPADNVGRQGTQQGAQTPAAANADKNNNNDKNANDKGNADLNSNSRNRNADQNTSKQAPTADTKPAPTQTQTQTQTPSQDKRAAEFIRRDNNAPRRSIDDLRKERKEVREGDRTVIKEGDRTIVREGNRTVIRHDEGLRFAIGARGVQVNRVGTETRTVITRPNGVRIVNITDANGRLIRRVRQDANGRQVVIINNRFMNVRPTIFVMLPPPVILIPRERYIVEFAEAPPPLVYATLIAEPVEPVAEHYTLEQVVYSAPLRDRMPRIDLDINFETGSWQLTPEQVDKLGVIAEGLNKAIAANPSEVFTIEGYTDAVGTNEDNLSLSDRRAEAVAVALTEQFQVPPENLVTQGYGEESLKVQTQGPEQRNRRVSVRRVTPLLDQSASDEPATSGQRQ